jgi:hypothetical protein
MYATPTLSAIIRGGAAITTPCPLFAEFRRRLGGAPGGKARDDTLYCLALMQHHGAPTRLLDCTYSPFAAVAFAMENGTAGLPKKQRPTPVVWCFRGQWCEDEAKKATPGRLVERRNADLHRSS